MKITIGHAELAAAAAFAARGLPTSPPVPVMAGLKLTARDGQLAITGFDYDTSATATAVARVGEAGSVLVPGRLLADISRALRHEVGITLDGERLVLTSGSARFTLHTLPLAEYPTLPQAPTASGTAAGKELADAVGQVAVAAGRDDTLPVLTGVQLEVGKDTLVLAATDRYRLAVRTLEWEPTTSGIDSATILVPAKQLAVAAKELADTHQVAVGLPDGQREILGLTGETRQTTIRLLEGALPKYDAFMDVAPTTVMTVDTAAMAEAVKRVALVAERGTPIRLTLADDGLTIQAGSSDDAQALDRTDARLDGTPAEIAFNPTFLADGLKAIGADATQITISDPVKPALLHAADAPESALRYLLMPVRLSG
jgi:DNA polymerase-3 subunit beta